MLDAEGEEGEMIEWDEIWDGVVFSFKLLAITFFAGLAMTFTWWIWVKFAVYLATK
jgi:hypothetical protein